MIYYIILRNTLYKINGILIVKAEDMLSLIKPISIKKSLYTNIFNKKNLASINKIAKIPGKNKDLKIPDIKYIIFKSKYITFSRLRSKIQFI